MKIDSHSIVRACLIAFSSCFISQSFNEVAKAEFLNSSAGGTGARISVSVVGFDAVDINAGGSSRSGKPDYNASSALIDLNTNATGGIPPITTLTIANVTGVADSQSFGTFSLNPTENLAFGEGGVTGLNLGIGRLSTFLDPGNFAVSISADALSSSSSIAGTLSGASVEGESIFTNLNISVLGTALNLSALEGAVTIGNGISFAPNTTVALSALGTGARLYLNEQVQTSDQFGNFSISTNALRLDLVGVELAPGIGVLSSDVALGSSFAIAAVPEPGSILAICAAGGAMFGTGLRKRRRLNKVAEAS